MHKTIFSFLFFFSFSFVLFAQKGEDNETRLKKGEDLNMLYRNEGSFGLFIHSAGGVGLSYRRGYHVTANRNRMFEVEVQNFKHPKEIKSMTAAKANAKGFVYGKLNSFLIFRPGVGYQNVLYQKTDKKSVEIRASYYIGGIINFAKPVYLLIRNNQNDQTISTERYDPARDSLTNIYGKADFFYGMENTKIYPGGYAKFALSFEYSNRYNGIKAIETGVIADVYPQVLPMMAYINNQQIYVELYLKMIWGKKWF